MVRGIWVVLLALTHTLAATSAKAQQTSALPNVLFIMVDDMGHSDLSLTGSHHIQTPNIDGLAHDGLWLQQGYSSTPICSPTPTALLTGNYAQRYEVGLLEPLRSNANPQLGIPVDVPAIASVFRDRGYYTALVGKWHLGKPPLHGPLQHGYEDFYGIIDGAADYFRHRLLRGGEEVGFGLARGNEPISDQGYLSDLFGDQAIAAIERAGDRPFFLSLHFNAPHWPWEGREDHAVADLLVDTVHGDGGNIEKYREMMEVMCPSSEHLALMAA